MTYRELTIKEHGVRCACTVAECNCRAEADFAVAENPICGCCAGDCPDVHPERSAALAKKFDELISADTASKEMLSEGAPLTLNDFPAQALPIRIAFR